MTTQFYHTLCLLPAWPEKTCEFLLENTFNGTHFSFIGCKGWYERGLTKVTFDQQPIEAASTVIMLKAAYDATKQKRFLTLQRKAFDWFLGANDLYIPVYNFRTKGCHDGLTQDGVNANQGAESTLSFLLSLLAIVESYALIDKVDGGKSVSSRQDRPTGQTIKKPIPIKSIPAKAKSAKKQLEKLA